MIVNIPGDQALGNMAPVSYGDGDCRRLSHQDMAV